MKDCCSKFDTAEAASTSHDFKFGGRSEYVLKGPTRSFEVKDSLLGEDGKPPPDMPAMRIRFTFEPHEGGTRMGDVETFPSIEALEKLLEIVMEEGLKAVMAQIDGVLADTR